MTMYNIFPELRGDPQAEFPITECAVCGCEIYEGEEIYHVGDQICCQDCVWKDVAERT